MESRSNYFLGKNMLDRGERNLDVWADVDYKEILGGMVGKVDLVVYMVC